MYIHDTPNSIAMNHQDTSCEPNKVPARTCHRVPWQCQVNIMAMPSECHGNAMPCHANWQCHGAPWHPIGCTLTRHEKVKNVEPPLLTPTYYDYQSSLRSQQYRSTTVICYRRALTSIARVPVNTYIPGTGYVSVALHQTQLQRSYSTAGSSATCPPSFASSASSSWYQT